eukprot:CAMPEP_0118638712 /NCGR_PEP_ID=MMETSP0785-20121206/3841_1 /TAXON_ID=91992 /ORGANISM="Bolidomonas pacifica, Strain CCMP 1866" /LENGTH=1167 /DNA_ID=CAMNT_0006530001 /DNA_START=130 /DNA_END=3631 /DNA_ORIENTATION=+
MSGFGESIAQWAGLSSSSAAPPPTPPSDDAPMSPEEIREKRLARMQGGLASSTPTADKGKKAKTRIDFNSPPLGADASMEVDVDNEGGVTPMEGVEETNAEDKNDRKMMASTMPNLGTTQSLPDPPSSTLPAASATMRAISSPTSTMELNSSPSQPKSSPRKSHLMKLKKRDNTMNKVLHLTTMKTKVSSTLVYVEVEVDHDPNDEFLGTVKADIDQKSLQSVIASRLAMGPNDEGLKNTNSKERQAIYYLTGIYDRAGMEAIALKGKSNEDLVLTAMLNEIQDLAVSYCVSSLTVPDLFESAVEAPSQLFACLGNNSNNIASGKEASFLHRVCKELEAEDLEEVVGALLKEGIKNVKHECILDPSFQSSLHACRALTALFSYKPAALVTVKENSFLLPPASSPNANTIVTPDLTGYDVAQQNFMRMMMSMQARHGNAAGGMPPRAYKQRSGPALEKTLLGTFLSLGLPLRDSNFVAQFNNAARRTMVDINNVRSSLRKQNKGVRDSTDALVMSLLKGGAPSRTSVLNVSLADALLVNISATQSYQYRDASKVTSQHALLNITQALLKLSMPFVNDAKKRKLINVGFLSNENAHLGVYTTSGDNKVDRLGGEEAPQSQPTNSSNGDFNFTTQCFFLTARALNLGLFPLTNQLLGVNRHLGHMNYMIRGRGGDATSDPRFQALHSQSLCLEIHVADTDFLRDVVKFYDLVAETIISCDKPTIQAMPEFFVNDICEILLFTTHQGGGVNPDVLKGVSLGNIFNLVVLLLSEEYASTIRNYNLRARLGDILFNVFLPSEFKREDEGRSNSYGDDIPYTVCCDPSNGSPYLLSSKSAQESLAPSLLLLYGQVEHTGPYDKQDYRSRICSLLKYLWNSNEHRAAFAKIASNERSFVEFANGVLNETNQLILVMIDKLPQIKNIQEQMKATTWSTNTQEEQDEVTGRLNEHEREVRSALMLANKTMKMFAFLSTDDKIAELFQGKELSTRLVNVLLYVLTNMLGSKGLDMKVDNPESYNWKPKELLGDLVSILTCFVDSEAIHTAMAQCGYYNDKILHKLLKTTQRLGIKDANDDKLSRLISAVEGARASSLDLEEVFKDPPEEYLDSLVYDLMEDPVILPTSPDYIVDRSTIAQHLLNDPHDPFNRQPLTMDQVKPNTELKGKIEAWKEERI